MTTGTSRVSQRSPFLGAFFISLLLLLPISIVNAGDSGWGPPFGCALFTRGSINVNPPPPAVLQNNLGHRIAVQGQVSHLPEQTSNSFNATGNWRVDFDNVSVNDLDGKTFHTTSISTLKFCEEGASRQMVAELSGHINGTPYNMEVGARESLSGGNDELYITLCTPPASTGSFCPRAQTVYESRFAGPPYPTPPPSPTPAPTPVPGDFPEPAFVAPGGSFTIQIF